MLPLSSTLPLNLEAAVSADAEHAANSSVFWNGSEALHGAFPLDQLRASVCRS